MSSLLTLYGILLVIGIIIPIVLLILFFQYLHKIAESTYNIAMCMYRLLDIEEKKNKKMYLEDELDNDDTQNNTLN